jgi:hypothetical protein
MRLIAETSASSGARSVANAKSRHRVSIAVGEARRYVYYQTYPPYNPTVKDLALLNRKDVIEALLEVSRRYGSKAAHDIACKLQRCCIKGQG